MTRRWLFAASAALQLSVAACGGAANDHPASGASANAPGGPANAAGDTASAAGGTTVAAGVPRSAGAGNDSSATAPAAASLPVSFADLAAIHKNLQGRRGHPVFVNFWATWCGPCVEELPQLAALSREEAALGTDFVGISTDAWVTGEGAETETKVRAFMARAGIVYTNLIYRGDQDPLLNAFKLPGPIPFSILYDGQGRIVTSWTGPVPIAEVRRRLAGLRLPG